MLICGQRKITYFHFLRKRIIKQSARAVLFLSLSLFPRIRENHFPLKKKIIIGIQHRIAYTIQKSFFCILSRYLIIRKK